jgi:hypothetical protein
MQSHGSRFVRDMERLGATDAWDFVNQSYLRAGRVTASGITFTRASVGSYLNNNNTMTVFSSGQPRIGDKGILIEGSRQNLFLNSAVGATQSITVTAAAHTLSFFGTGTVTLSGVSTAGPLVGTGEFNRVSLTFTPTAGSLTLTVSGDIKWVNLELGSFPSSWIPSDGTAVTRAADVATAVPTAGTDYPLTLFAEFKHAISASSFQTVCSIDNGSSADRAELFLNASANLRLFVRKNSTTQADVVVAGAVATESNSKVAGRIVADDVLAARDGVLSSLDTAAETPATPSRIFFGATTGNLNFLFGYVHSSAIIPRALTDAKLEGVTQ